VAVAEDDRVDQDPQLVEQAHLDEADRQGGAAEDGDALARLLLEPGDLLGHVAADERGVVPVGRGQGGGHHDLGQGVHQLGDHRVVLPGGRGGPVAGHPLVGQPAEQEQVGVVELLDPELVELLVDVRPVELPVRALVEAVQGHHHERVQLAHRNLPWSARCGRVSRRR
jgi:hypothetical protein